MTETEAPPDTVTAQTVTAQTVTAAWVDEVRSNDTEPSKSQIGQVARTAKELLAGNDPTRVLAAARSAGQRGFVGIDRELTAMNGRAATRPTNGHPQRIPTTQQRVDAIEALRRPES